MEYFYTAYTKKIADKNYFFIKRHMVFPELNNAASVLDGYGMHTDFNKACDIAGINKTSIRQELWTSVSPHEQTARIIHINFPESRSTKMHWQQWLFRIPLPRLKFRF